MLTRASSLSLLIPLFFGIFHHKYFDKGGRLFFMYIVASSVFEAISFILSLYKLHTVSLIHAFTFVEFFLLLSFFFIVKELRNRYLFIILSALFFLIWILEKLLTSENNNQFSSFNQSYESLVLASFSIWTLAGLIKEINIPIVRLPIFWCSAGVLIYFTGNFLHYTLIVGENADIQLYVLWQVHSVLNILTSICFAVSFRCHYLLQKY